MIMGEPDEETYFVSGSVETCGDKSRVYCALKEAQSQ